MIQSTNLLKHLRTVVQSKTDFPVGTLVYFGSDDSTVTRIAAIIIPDPGLDPVIHTWSGLSISTDPQAVREIGEFFQYHKVISVVMTEGVVGCPHDEGIDYPFGSECPHCPFWAKT